MSNTLDITDFKVPEWMTTDFFQKCLHEHEGFEDIVVTDFSADLAVPPGNNYGSVVFRVNVNYSVSDELHDLSLVLKGPITEGPITKLLADFTDTEPIFYNKFIPEVYKVVNCHFVPKVFNSPISTIIVMEDLKCQGYLMADRIKQLDFEHCCLYAKAASKLHAVSSVLYKENPELIGSICAESVYTNENSLGQLLKNMGLWGVECVAKHISNEKISKILTDSSDKLWDMLIDIHKPSETFNCVVQGDPWVTNMMFKYDCTGKVYDIKLLDFQMVTFTSPIHDLVTFIWASANDEVREKRLEDLYSYYFHHLNENLRLLNGDQIDYDSFIADIKKFCPLAMVTAVMLPGILNPKPMDLDGIVTLSSNGSSNFGHNPMEQYYTETYCSEKLPLLVKHLETAGVFDYLEQKIF